jgi:hypothetical protein
VALLPAWAGNQFSASPIPVDCIPLLLKKLYISFFLSFSSTIQGRLKGQSPFKTYSLPFPFEGEGDTGDRVD